MNSCSFNTTTNDLYEFIRNDLDVLVTAGAGNSSDHCGENAYIYPAAYESVISVSSVGHLHDQGHPDQFNWKDVHERYIGDVSSTHHHNDKVDICAPGYDVVSTISFGPNNYFRSNGTSFAAPMVAGTAALVFSSVYFSFCIHTFNYCGNAKRVKISSSCSMAIVVCA